MKKHVIWSNGDLKLEDWEDCLKDWEPEITDESEQWELVHRWNDEYLDDERANLNIPVPGGILVIGDLGLWYGRRMGYKERTLYNIRDCLSDACGDIVTWYVDEKGDLLCEDCHHDGTNYYTYRAWKKGVGEKAQTTLKNKLYFGTATRQDITRVTRRLGDDIAHVYGWRI